MTTPEPPAPISRLVVSGDPSGTTANLSWEGYNEWAERDVTRYDVYLSPHAFTNVSGMTPIARVAAETQTLALTGLPAGEDHFFAVVPVDATGGRVPGVVYAAAYPLARETVSREFSLFVGAEETPFRELVSREVSVVVATPDVPAPVTGLDSGFAAVGSRQVFRAIELDWAAYNAEAQRDVARFRVYAGPAYYEDVSGLEPYAILPGETTHWTATGFAPLGIYYLSVVAEDVLGQWNPAVRSVSAQASIDRVREVQNLQVVCGTNWLRFSWQPPAGADPGQNELLEGYRIEVAGQSAALSVARTATNLVLSDLQPARGYPFRIVSIDNAGRASEGASLLAATLMPSPPGIRVQPLDGMLRVTWDHVEPNELVWKYAVYVAPTDFTSVAGLQRAALTRNRRVDLTGLDNGKTYFVAVTTVNIAQGEGQDVRTLSAVPTPLAGDFADLAVGDVVAPSQIYPGGEATFEWTVRNIGLGSPSRADGTGVSAWDDQLVLSRNETLGDADDVIVGHLSRSAPLGPGGSYTAGTRVVVPRLPLGDYHVFIRVDALDGVYEGMDAGDNEATATNHLLLRLIEPLVDQATDEAHLLSLNLAGALLPSKPAGAVVAWDLLSRPPGMRIDPETGRLTWVPSEAQGPSTNSVLVLTTDVGDPSLRTTNRFEVVVREVNTAPVIGSPVPPPADPGPLLANGGFELPGLGLPPYYQFLTDGDTSTLLRWTVIDDGVGAPSVLGHRVEYPNDVWEGDYSVLLNAGAGLAATFAAQAGTEYELSFYAAPTGTKALFGDMAPLVVEIGGQGFEFNFGAMYGWEPKHLRWTAQATDRATPLRVRNPSVSGDWKAYALDAFRLRALVGPLPDVVVNAGQQMVLAVAAADTDEPANRLRFDLAAGPEGMLADPLSGRISWTPGAEAVGTWEVAVRATDDGDPPLSGTHRFRVVVRPPPIRPTLGQFNIAEPGVIEFTLTGEADRRYRIDTSVDLMHWIEQTRVHSTREQTIVRVALDPDRPHRFYRAVVE